MNTTSKTKGLWIALYCVAAITVLVGIGLNISGSVRVGTLLIGMSIALSGSAALKLGHLKRW